MSTARDKFAKAMLGQLLRVAASEKDTRAGRVITVSSANPEWYKHLKDRWLARHEPPSLTPFELGLSMEVPEWLRFILN
ncbi:hypothetical protein ACHAO7_012174 [Fusarium culmorum]